LHQWIGNFEELIVAFSWELPLFFLFIRRYSMVWFRWWACFVLVAFVLQTLEEQDNVSSFLQSIDFRPIVLITYLREADRTKFKTPIAMIIGSISKPQLFGKFIYLGTYALFLFTNRRSDACELLLYIIWRVLFRGRWLITIGNSIYSYFNHRLHVVEHEEVKLSSISKCSYKTNEQNWSQSCRPI
jgi:hypothetical protein